MVGFRDAGACAPVGPGHDRSHESAELLMGRAAAGSEQAFGELVRRFRREVVEHATGIVGSEDAAEDIAQEVFVRVWRCGMRWRQTGSARAFLHRITRNLSLNHERGEGRQRDRAERYARENGRRTPTPADDFEDRSVRERVGRAIRGLPPRRREVLVRARLRRASYSSIAHAMAISPQTVANHLTRATADLRVMLAER